MLNPECVAQWENTEDWLDLERHREIDEDTGRFYTVFTVSGRDRGSLFHKTLEETSKAEAIKAVNRRLRRYEWRPMERIHPKQRV